MDREQFWIRAIQTDGSRKAADRLVRAYYDEIYRFAYRQVGGKEDAMDLTQEIMIAALQALPSYDPGKAAFRTWLYRVAAHKIVDWRRRRGPESLSLDEAPEVTLPAPGDMAKTVHDRLTLRALEAYVATQDPETQAVYRLRLYAEKSFPEIAAALGKPENTVKSRYHRLIAKLRKEFWNND